MSSVWPIGSRHTPLESTLIISTHPFQTSSSVMSEWGHFSTLKPYPIPSFKHLPLSRRWPSSQPFKLILHLFHRPRGWTHHQLSRPKVLPILTHPNHKTSNPFRQTAFKFIDHTPKKLSKISISLSSRSPGLVLRFNGAFILFIFFLKKFLESFTSRCVLGMIHFHGHGIAQSSYFLHTNNPGRCIFFFLDVKSNI